MTEIPGIDYEVVLKRKCMLLWSHQIEWAKVNETNLSSLVRILLQKEIRRQAKEVNE